MAQAAISAFHTDENCSRNDCKVVLNHLLRKISEPFTAAGGSAGRLSNAVATACQNRTPIKIERDHSIPVDVLVEFLMQKPTEANTHLRTDPKYLSDFLNTALKLVFLTRGEHQSLTALALQNRLPDGCYASTKGADIARYQVANIGISDAPVTKETLKTIKRLKKQA